MEMNKIAKYLFNDKYYKENEEMITNKIKCLVEELMPNDYDRFGTIHRQKQDSEQYLTYDRGYEYFINNCIDIEKISCHALYRLKQAQEIDIYNYSIPDQINVFYDKYCISNETKSKMIVDTNDRSCLL